MWSQYYSVISDGGGDKLAILQILSTAEAMGGAWWDKGFNACPDVSWKSEDLKFAT